MCLTKGLNRWRINVRDENTEQCTLCEIYTRRGGRKNTAHTHKRHTTRQIIIIIIIKGREATLCRFLFMAINRKLKTREIKRGETRKGSFFFPFLLFFVFRVGIFQMFMFSLKIKILQV